ncbi:DUF4062 domain-containing protein [Nocardioides sp. BP30]|uniref:DUF4062 domain-containing protein n=1 Tax=Nocardioides sp. BP30 TaxID=3036374 RepID=UPI002468CDBE|nr:DUF4062 domain-containing protein [Nocardioides sp. BP30]WGL51596.1 DUF4062 domain-containing protein [Nocardioides sp. BP30]
MAVERREQVFVSSTYLDLQEERQAVIQTLLEADCLPAGMELFPASDSDKWDLIRAVIDDSDYYVVVVGGRYGSLDDDGLSFTEKEFDYAVETKTPVMGFIHSDAGAIAAGKTDLEPELRKKLEAFRTKVEQRMVKYWTSPEELAGAVAVSLIKTRKSHPAIGWVRGDNAMSPEVETEIAQLRERVATLTQQLQAREQGVTDEDVSGFAQGSDVYRMPVRIAYWNKDEAVVASSRKFLDTRLPTTWDGVFAQVAPLLMVEASEQSIGMALRRHAAAVLPEHGSGLPFPEGAGKFRRDPAIQEEARTETIVQLFALGLIQESEKRHPVTDRDTYWSLTERGRAHLTRLTALRKGQAEPLDKDAEDDALGDEEATAVDTLR